LKFLKGFTEEDILEVTNAIVDGNFKSYDDKAYFGDALNFEFTASQVSSSIGTRMVLHSVY
jgi:hypothetical protein